MAIRAPDGANKNTKRPAPLNLSCSLLRLSIPDNAITAAMKAASQKQKGKVTKERKNKTKTKKKNCRKEMYEKRQEIKERKRMKS